MQPALSSISCKYVAAVAAAAQIWWISLLGLLQVLLLLLMVTLKLSHPGPRKVNT